MNNLPVSKKFSCVLSPFSQSVYCPRSTDNWTLLLQDLNHGPREPRKLWTIKCTCSHVQSCKIVFAPKSCSVYMYMYISTCTGNEINLSFMPDKEIVHCSINKFITTKMQNRRNTVSICFVKTFDSTNISGNMEWNITEVWSIPCQKRKNFANIPAHDKRSWRCHNVRHLTKRLPSQTNKLGTQHKSLSLSL